MVGDTAIDIQTGTNASLQAVIGVTHGFGTRQELEEAGADYVVDSLTELDELVERLGNGED
jgi:phosphoglycolate phosphatase